MLGEGFERFRRRRGLEKVFFLRARCFAAILISRTMHSICFVRASMAAAVFFKSRMSMRWHRKMKSCLIVSACSEADGGRTWKEELRDMILSSYLSRDTCR